MLRYSTLITLHYTICTTTITATTTAITTTATATTTTTLHYTTLITLHYNTLHYTRLQLQLQTQPQPQLQLQPRYITQHYATLITLHYNYNYNYSYSYNYNYNHATLHNTTLHTLQLQVQLQVQPQLGARPSDSRGTNRILLSWKCSWPCGAVSILISSLSKFGLWNFQKLVGTSSAWHFSCFLPWLHVTSLEVYMNVSIPPNTPPTPPQEEISNVEEQTQVKASSVACDKCGSVHERQHPTPPHQPTPPQEEIK